MSIPFNKQPEDCPYVSDGRGFCFAPNINIKFGASCWIYEFGMKHQDCLRFKEINKYLLNKKLKKIKR